MGYPSNQEAWGVVLDFTAAALLEDAAMFARAERDWKASFNEWVKNNVPVHEVYRQGGTQGNGSSGLFYSNFMACALTFGAEWARSNGVWLYHHVAPDRSTLQGLNANVAKWTRSPETFTCNTSGAVSSVNEIIGHYEVLHALWPSADTAWLVIDRYGFRYLTVTHLGQPLRG